MLLLMLIPGRFEQGPLPLRAGSLQSAAGSQGTVAPRIQVLGWPSLATELESWSTMCEMWKYRDLTCHALTDFTTSSQADTFLSTAVSSQLEDWSRYPLDSVCTFLLSVSSAPQIFEIPLSSLSDGSYEDATCSLPQHLPLRRRL